MIKTESGLFAEFREIITRKFASSSLFVAASGAVIAIVMVGLCGVVLYQSRQDALNHTRDTLRDIALIAERDIERNFELYDLSLQAVVDGLKDPEVMSLSPRLRREVLFDRAASAKYLGAMLVLDAKGNIVLDSIGDVPRQGNFADRKYFSAHRDNPDVGLYISDPYESRLRGGCAEHRTEPATLESGRLICGNCAAVGQPRVFPHALCRALAGTARLAYR